MYFKLNCCLGLIWIVETVRSGPGKCFFIFSSPFPHPLWSWITSASSICSINTELKCLLQGCEISYKIIRLFGVNGSDSNYWKYCDFVSNYLITRDFETNVFLVQEVFSTLVRRRLSKLTVTPVYLNLPIMVFMALIPTPISQLWLFLIIMENSHKKENLEGRNNETLKFVCLRYIFSL